jgi:hypothetical protein
METMVGFVAGYLAGCRDGEAGLQRLRDSLRAIRDSQEARRMAAEVVAFAGVAARRAASGKSISGLSGTVGTVTDMLAHRGSGNRAA